MTGQPDKQTPRIRVVGARYEPAYANRITFELLQRLPTLVEALDVAMAVPLHDATRKEFAELAKWLQGVRS